MISFEYENFSDLKNISSKIAERKESLRKNISSFIEKNINLELKLEGIIKTQPNFLKISYDANSLLQQTVTCSKDFHEVSAKVKSLDSAQANVASTLALIENILLIKKSSLKLDDALNSLDLQLASEVIQQLDRIDPKVYTLFSKLYKNDKTLNAIKESREKIYTILLEKLEDRGCQNTVTCLVKIGQDQKAIEIISKDLCREAMSEVKTTLTATSQIRDYITYLVKLIEAHGLIMKRHKRFVQETFIDSSNEIYSKITAQFIEFFYKGLLKFYAFTSWEELIKFCNSFYEDSLQKEADLKIRVIEQLIPNVSLVISRYMLFDQFISNLDKNSSIKNTEFIKVLCRDYLLFLRFNLTEMILKAEHRDEVDPKMNRIISIDDTFFIMKKILNYSIETSSVYLIVQTVGTLQQIITERIIVCFKAKIMAGIQGNWMSLFTMKKDQETIRDRSIYLAILNSLVAFREDLNLMVHDLKVDFSKMKIENISKNCDKLCAALDNMKIRMTEKIDEIVDNGFNIITETIVRQSIITLDAFKKTKYIIDDRQFDEYSINDPWVNAFLMKLDRNLNIFKQYFDEENFCRFLSHLIDELSSDVEKVIFKKRFNHTGGIQLEKEVRNLNQYFCNKGGWKVREKLVRLNQITTLLCLENISEGELYWNDSNWKLSPNEIRRCLILREEFRPSDVKNIDLKIR